MHPPPGSGNSMASPSNGAPTFFVDQKKGEINELKQVRWDRSVKTDTK